MIHGQKVVVVMPAYNAEGTLRQTFEEIPELVDDVLLVDDASSDQTVALAQELGIEVEVHPANRGYGGNQKTCYRLALERGADIVVMLHPDYQYSPKLVTAMASMVASGHYDVVLGSRILGKGALAGGMPLYKYVANRGLTLVENLLLGQKLSEYHTGFRAFSRQVLTTLPLAENSDDFVFDNEMLAQTVWWGFSIGEISTPARYFPEASSIGFTRSVRYGFGVLRAAIAYRLARFRLARPRIFRQEGRRLAVAALLLLALLGCVGPVEVDSAPAAGPEGGEAPAARNLVLVTIDTWRGDHFGGERAGEPLTPEMSRFAERAVVFTAAHSVADSTSPGVAGILTGLYPFRSGVMENQAVLQPPVPTLATRLQTAGFTTAAFVANPVLGVGYGFDRGFGRYELPPHQGLKAPGEAINRLALPWLERVRTSRPFFLWLHYVEPHGPYVPPPDLRALFPAERFTGPAEARLEPDGENRGRTGIPSYQQHYRYVYGEPEPSRDARDYAARYAAEVRHVDRLVGEVLAALEARGLLERTVVVITADHGEALAGDQGHWFSHGHGLTQDQIHVPLVLYHPGVEPATVAEPVSTADVAPTVLELLGLPAPSLEDPIDGVSLLSPEPRPVVAHTVMASGLRHGTWKLLFHRGAGWRLHDLAADPAESHDLAAARPELRDELEAALTELRRRPPIALPKLRENVLDREQRRQLEALGYL